MIALGSDHGGYDLKQKVKAYLDSKGIPYQDMGCDSKESCDYPVFAHALCNAVEAEDVPGILICGTGIGMCMAANKCRGIRAAVCHDNYSAERSILSNNGNVLCLGARIIGPELAKKVVGEWISLEFVDSPSTVKVADILRIEQENFKS